jgi:hypothetical protein
LQSPSKDGASPSAKPAATNIAAMLRAREGNLSGTGRFTRAQRAHVTAFRSTPMEAVQRVDRMRSRVYNGRFSRSGNVFVGAPLIHELLIGARLQSRSASGAAPTSWQ